MSAEFYERDGELRVRLPSGGHGGGATGVVDVAATDEHKAEHRAAFAAFLASEPERPEAEAETVEPVAEPEPVVEPVAAAEPPATA